MAKYAVTYTTCLWIEAEDEEQAISIAIEEWEEMPDGTWEAEQIDG